MKDIEKIIENLKQAQMLIEQNIEKALFKVTKQNN